MVLAVWMETIAAAVGKIERHHDKVRSNAKGCCNPKEFEGLTSSVGIARSAD